MIPIAEAFKLTEEKIAPLGSEKVPIDQIVGRILAEKIVADMDLPPFDRSQMDGFAVRSEDVKDAPVDLRIVGESSAGHGWHSEMKRGEAVRIMTGARVPSGADTVQKVELTSEANFASEAAQRTEGIVTINEAIGAKKNIVRQGEEVRQGAVVMNAGDRINERMVATLAAFGYPTVSVGKSPSVSIMTTGSEVVDIDQVPGVDQIRNSNSVMLDALCRQTGAKTRLLSTPPDDLNKIKKMVGYACEGTDIAVITGGVSVGKYDLTKTALIDLGAEIYFERLRLKPGKPAVFARLGRTVIFGLPGNPVSAAVTFYLFVRKALLILQGATQSDLPMGYAIAGAALKAAKERDTYLPVKLDFDERARVTVAPVKWIGSSDFIGFGKADALAFVKSGDRIDAGGATEIFFL